MKQIFIVAMSTSLAFFIFTSLYIGEVAWLYALDWAAWTIIGVAYLIYRSRYLKALKSNMVSFYEVPKA